MNEILILTTMSGGVLLSEIRERSCIVVSLYITGDLCAAIDDLKLALNRYPPTSLAKAKNTWMPLAQKLALELSRQAADQGFELDWDSIPRKFSQILVASKVIVPIDLIPCGSRLLGAEVEISHIVDEGAVSPAKISAQNSEVVLPLRRIAHVCTYDPGATSLHQMDVVSATLGIDNRLAMEHYFYPASEVASSLFSRGDLDILHFECHGTSEALQIDNPYGLPCDVRRIYSPDGPSVYFFLGCSVGGDFESVAPSFVRMGAKASIGSYCRFLSGGDTGEVSLSAYYDELYQGLVAGKRLGEAVRAGRRAAFPGRIYYCAWLLFGNPNIRFLAKAFGGSRPNTTRWRRSASE